MKKLQLFSLVALLVFGLSGCKYEEGPFLSVIPKVERVTNTWQVDKAFEDGVEQASISGFKQITFFKEGGCNFVQDLGILGELAYTGTWEFSESKDAIIIALTDEPTGLIERNETYEILRLKEEELWVRYQEENLGGTTTEWIVYFEPVAP